MATPGPRVEAGFFDWQEAIDAQGELTSAEAPYFVFNVASESEALKEAQKKVAAKLGRLYLDEITLEERINGSTYKLLAHYKVDERQDRAAGDTEEGNAAPQVAFDTTGGTRHLNRSLETLSKTPATATDYGGAIEVDGEGNVNGVEVTMPTMTLSETHTFADAKVTSDYQKRLFTLTGTVNKATFRGFAAGEVLFLGASGQRSGDFWDLTFKFAVSPRSAVGTISGCASAKRPCRAPFSRSPSRPTLNVSMRMATSRNSGWQSRNIEKDVSMMRKVAPGDALHIRAADWNQLVEAAAFVAQRQRQEQSAGLRSGLGEGVLRVRNAETTSLPIYTVVALVRRSSSVTDYDVGGAVDGEAYYDGGFPKTETQPYAVLQEPLEPGQIGRARVCGITPVRLSGDGPFAAPNVAKESAGMLLRGESGSARVLCEPSKGSAWGIVLLGGGGGGGGGGSDVRLCEITGNTSEQTAGTGSYSVTILSLSDEGTELGKGTLFLTEIALGSRLPDGTRVLGHTVTLRATGGNE